MTSSVDWRRYEDSSLPRVLRSALGAFAEQGYHGTSIRDVASRSGLSVPGLYHHYRSKQDILLDLMVAVMHDLLGRSRAAMDAAAPDPRAQFEAVVECLLRFHMFRQAEAFVASSEIRSLTPENREAYVALRDEQQQMLEHVIAAGCADGLFSIPHPKDAARAISTLCVGVASWFRADGPLSTEEVVDRNLRMIRALLGVS